MTGAQGGLVQVGVVLRAGGFSQLIPTHLPHPLLPRPGRAAESKGGCWVPPSFCRVLWGGGEN